MIQLIVGLSFANLVVLGGFAFKAGRWMGRTDQRLAHLEERV